MQGCQARRGPCQERAAIVCDGKTEARSMQTEVERDQDSKGGVQRSYEESSVYLQFIFLMGGWGAKLVATAKRSDTCPVRVPRFTQSVRGMKGCGWRGEVKL